MEPLTVIQKIAGAQTEGQCGFATSLETARYLHLSKSMVNKLVAEGKIPARRFGRAVRVPWSWLLAQGREG
jgi:excisionase family DNA binding protein